VNSSVVPWDDLSDDQRAGLARYVRRQVVQLEDVGFMPTVPPGGPPRAASYRRVGRVRARRLDAGLHWNCSTGSDMLAHCTASAV